MLNINKSSRTIFNAICHKSQQLQFVEIRKMVSVSPAWSILTCASQNMDEEMVAVKIIQTYTANEKAVLKSILLVSLDNSSTLLFILDHSALVPENWKLLLACTLSRVSCVCSGLFIKKINEQEVAKLLRR